MTRLPILALGSLALLTLPAEATRLRVEDSAKIVRLTDPQISPDGKSIVLVIGRANLDDDRTDASLVLVDVATRTTRVLTTRPRAGFPRWSPSGTTLAFLAADDKKVLQIFTLSLTSPADSTQLTHSPTSIEQFAFRPDSLALAYVAEDDTPEPKGRAKFNDAFEIGNNDFLAHSPQPSAHLWLLNLPAQDSTIEAPKPRRLTSGTWSLPISLPPGPPASPIQWSADGKSIYFVRVPTALSGDADHSTIQLLDVASATFKPLTGAANLESVPVLSPDGAHLAYLRNRDGHSWNGNDVFLAPSAPSTLPTKDLSLKLDRNIVRAQWMPDGQSLLVGANDATTTALWLLPASGTAPAQRLDLGIATSAQPFWVEASIARTGAIAFTGSTPSAPSELFLIDPAHGPAVQLTHLNAEISSREIAAQESFTWPSLKGGPLSDGVLTFPIAFDPAKKYPLVLYIHGGPTAASHQSWSAFSQLLAAQGWLVYEPNYRGSDNLGNTYQAAIFNDAGQGPGEDVMAGLAVLLKRPYIDPQNIAVSGWSYGGYMTSWLLGHSTLWKAAVDGAPVTDWVDMYNLSDGNITTADNFGGTPYTSPDLMRAYRAQSPITYVSAVRTPTLLMCDVGDYRVPITQTYSFFRALRANNVKTEFIAFPIPGHNATDPIRRQDVQRRWIQWLARYLPTAPNAEATEPRPSM